MSGFGTRPTAAPIPVDANRQALAQALLGLPARVGQSFQNMANAGLQANEAFLQGRGTDGEDMLARPFLPGADTGGRLGALASFVGSNMALGGPAGSLGAGPSMPSKGIRAYHGSPHDFDRFDLSKIGTGEGAQAYGHGLYFAENEGVARAYRDALAKSVNDGNPAYRSAQDWLQQWSSPQEARSQIDNWISDFQKRGQTDLAKEYAAMRDQLDNPNLGRMYEVNIRARPEQFLDWDAPLSAQPGAIRALEDAGIFTGRRDFADWSALVGPGGVYVNPADAGQRAYIAAQQGMGPGNASQAFRDAGIPGIRYLDQGSRAAGDGSRNYVIFDDKLIEILRKYGLAGLTAGGVGMTAGGEAQANPLAGALLGYQPQE